MIYVNIPIQMISCTDTSGKITPLRFRFIDSEGELITVKVENILSDDQSQSKVGISFSCMATFYGREKQFVLYYSYYSHEWKLSWIAE